MSTYYSGVFFQSCFTSFYNLSDSIIKNTLKKVLNFFLNKIPIFLWSFFLTKNSLFFVRLSVIGNSKDSPTLLDSEFDAIPNLQSVFNFECFNMFQYTYSLSGNMFIIYLFPFIICLSVIRRSLKRHN